MCTRKPNASSHKQRSSCDSFLSNFDHFHVYPQPPGNSSSPCHAIKCNHCCPAPRRKTRGCPIFLCGSTPGLPRSTTSSLSLRSSSYCCRGMLAGIHSEDAPNNLQRRWCICTLMVLMVLMLARLRISSLDIFIGQKIFMSLFKLLLFM